MTSKALSALDLEPTRRPISRIYYADHVVNPSGPSTRVKRPVTATPGDHAGDPGATEEAEVGSSAER